MKVEVWFAFQHLIERCGGALEQLQPSGHWLVSLHSFPVKMGQNGVFAVLAKITLNLAYHKVSYFYLKRKPIFQEFQSNIEAEANCFCESFQAQTT